MEFFFSLEVVGTTMGSIVSVVSSSSVWLMLVDWLVVSVILVLVVISFSRLTVGIVVVVSVVVVSCAV